MICIPITARSRDAIIAEMRAAADVADLIELRVDYAPGVDLKTLIDNRTCPVIVTCRPTREGGLFDGPEADRIALLQQAMDLGADYVDAELDSIGRIERRGATQLIVSHHDFEKTPEDIDRIHRQIAATGADIVKIACMACDIRDNLRMFDLLRRSDRKMIGLCMGEAGLISRIIGRKYGNFLTFAALSTGKESAPGQISASDLIHLYRYKKIGANTAVYGVMANPVVHSMSPAILNAAFADTGLDAVYVPLKVECNAVEFVDAFRALDVQGYSVTIPHKQDILPAMDDLDDIVRQVGALNTVANRGGKLFGTNTDVPGALGALEAAMDSSLAGKRALLLGAGGAARALAYGLTARDVTVMIANRTHKRGETLAREVGAECCRLSEIASCEADILINTTSVGMHPNVDATPAPREALRPGMIVFDAVYNPIETRLLREAREAGCVTISGITWFVNQASAQFELWTKKPAPRKTMERVLRERLEGKE